MAPRAAHHRWIVTGIGLCAALTAPAAWPHPAAQHLGFVESETEALDGAPVTAATVSGDGAQLYVAANQAEAGQGGSLLVLARDAQTGGLSFQSAGGLSAPNGGPFVSQLELSSNQTELYVPLPQTDSIALLSRDPADGSLGLLATSGTFTNLNGATGVEIAPDGTFVYISSANESGLTILRYDASMDEVAFSEFQQLADVFNNLRNIHFAELSPDGNHLYLSWRDTNGFRFLWTTSRDAMTGRVSVTQTISSVPGGTSVFFPNRIFASPDGAHLYVAYTDGLAVYDRDAQTGALSFVSLNTLSTQSGSATPQGLVFDATGEHAYTTVSGGVGVIALLTLHRDVQTGAISVVDEEVLAQADGAGRPVLSPDGAHLYVPQQVARSVEIYAVPEPGVGELGALALAVVGSCRALGARQEPRASQPS